VKYKQRRRRVYSPALLTSQADQNFGRVALPLLIAALTLLYFDLYLFWPDFLRLRYVDFKYTVFIFRFDLLLLDTCWQQYLTVESSIGAFAAVVVLLLDLLFRFSLALYGREKRAARYFATWYPTSTPPLGIARTITSLSLYLFI
jgi:hypothetical protein